MRTDVLLTRSAEEAAGNSRQRREQLSSWPGAIAGGGFGWVAPPVLNPMTRLAVEICPAAAILRVRGYERAEGCELPEPVNELRETSAAVA
jgi:hypothetical protein